MLMYSWYMYILCKQKQEHTFSCSRGVDPNSLVSSMQRWKSWYGLGTRLDPNQWTISCFSKYRLIWIVCICLNDTSFILLHSYCSLQVLDLAWVSSFHCCSSKVSPNKPLKRGICLYWHSIFLSKAHEWISVWLYVWGAAVVAPSQPVMEVHAKAFIFWQI